ncbi:E3 ubiquitin protein ligase DRIP2-like [Panicum miliaceum]|uniref:E3 ubiquitin protein ligase DRIP2-like n=1 Tax=Panicum miliaceum TaxID=4540 RepID=A0A3L6S792_PANMI|nr:E3 ubiquitin protein ligase DRIP2-like [Panicum miliaceum]
MESAVLACEATGSAAAPGAGGGGGVGDVVRLKRSALAACLTCPLCDRLLRDAATITQCLHTFCRKCISEEFINKEVCCCPICSIDLGCAPLEKLRIDHSLQYVRSKIFPKKQKVEGPEVTSSVTSPIKRKERSLSSLTIPAPQVSMQKCLTKRRTKASCSRNLSLHTKLRGSNITKEAARKKKRAAKEFQRRRRGPVISDDDDDDDDDDDKEEEEEEEEEEGEEEEEEEEEFVSAPGQARSSSGSSAPKRPQGTDRAGRPPGTRPRKVLGPCPRGRRGARLGSRWGQPPSLCLWPRSRGAAASGRCQIPRGRRQARRQSAPAVLALGECKLKFLARLAPFLVSSCFC